MNVRILVCRQLKFFSTWKRNVIQIHNISRFSSRSKVKVPSYIQRNIQHSRRMISTSTVYGSKQSEDSDMDDEWDSFDVTEVNEEYMLPSGGHRVLVIQPDIKWGPLKPKLTTTQLQLEEACALAESLPRWTVVDKLIYTQKKPHKGEIAGKDTMHHLTDKVVKSGASAVFMSMNMLTGSQLAMLQEHWKVPVYDRYTIVLQIFQTRARTNEAKIQVALAQIPYLRSRLPGMHAGTLDQQRGGLGAMGGSGETFLETRQRLLRKKEVKLKNALASLKGQREVTRNLRTKKECPVVAVVGYTNAGKTSLIKSLTREADMMPRDQLFATLDVTAHAGILPNKMKVLYIDTVGFISNIPTCLIEAFMVTMEDVLRADVVIHVRDRSHPDHVAQKHNVLTTLQSMGLPQEEMDNIIEVCNKMDLVSPGELNEEEQAHSIQISATEGAGLHGLRATLQEHLMEATGRLHKLVRIPQNGQHLSWLYKEATVEATHTCVEDSEALIVECIFTQTAWAKFQAYFRNDRKDRDKDSKQKYRRKMR